MREELVKAHHGSLAREQRVIVEDKLKRGELRAIVATSSLELGIDMGAVDLVIQVESPGAVSRGLQRIGRAGHQVGEPSKGSIYPKHRGDLLEAADRRAPDARRADRVDPLPAQPARRAGPADRRPHRPGGGDTRRRAGRARAPVGQLRRAVRRAVRQHARPAGRPLPERGVLRAAAAGRVEPRQRHGPGPRRLQAAGRHVGRHDPRPWPVRRVPARRHAGRRARRGDGLREPSGRDVRARRVDVAHRGHHVPEGHRHAGARRAGEDAVLARRPAGPPAGAGPGARRVRPRAARAAAGRRPSTCCARTTPSTRSPRPTCCSTSTSRPRRPASCPTTARSSSSASATRSATGASACSARSARRSTRRGRWPSSAG